MLENAWWYCTQKITPPGSDWYYALLKAPVEIRQAIVALLSLEADWHAISFECHEPTLTDLKWAWWRNEIAQTYNSNATHPALQLLQPLLSTFALPEKLLSALLEQAQIDAQPYRFECFSELKRAAFSRVDALFIIGLYVLGQRQSELSATLHPLIFSLQLWQNIHRLAFDLRRGVIAFANEDLHTYALPLESPWQHDTALTQLLMDYHQHATHLYQQALDSWSQEQRRQLKPLVNFAKLQWARANAIQRAGFPVLNQTIELSPLRKLCLTWFTN